MKDKKQMILSFLKTIKFASTNKIANNIHSNQYDTENYLMELLGEGKIGLTNSPDEQIRWWHLIRKFKSLPKNQTMKDIKKEVSK